MAYDAKNHWYAVQFAGDPRSFDAIITVLRNMGYPFVYYDAFHRWPDGTLKAWFVSVNRFEKLQPYFSNFQEYREKAHASPTRLRPYSRRPYTSYRPRSQNGRTQLGVD